MGEYRIPLQPRTSGVLVLTLDWGGMRGIVQLVTLRRIASLIGFGLPIGEFFDLIVGLGSGRVGLG